MKRKPRKQEDGTIKFLDGGGSILLVSDVDQKISFINKKGCEILGFEEEEILGKNLFELPFFKTSERGQKPTFRRAMGKRGKTSEWRFINDFILHDEEERIFSWHNVVMKNEKGEKTGILSLGEDITGRRRAEKIQSVLYKIADAINTTKDLPDLFKSIQTHLGMIVDTTNFYIALYEKETDTISIPHLVDEKDTFTSFPAGKSLSAFVIKRGKPILLTWEKIEKLIKKGELEQVGTPSKVWLGVPLKMRKEVIGVVAVQSYTDVSLYTEKDLEILEFVSGQIAIAIQRKRAEEALKESKNKIEQLHIVAARMEAAQSEEEIYRLTMDAAGGILDFSQASIQYVEDDYLKIAVTTEKNIPEDYKMSIHEGLGGKTFRTGKSYLVGNIAKDIDTKPTDEEFRSILSVPIGSFGVFQAFSYKLADFNKEDLELAELLMSHVNESLKRIKSEEALRKSKDKIEQLHRISARMEAAQTEDEVCHLAMDAAGRILDFVTASIQYVEDGYLKIKITTEENVPEDYRMSINEGIGGKTYRTGKSYLVDDIIKDKDAKPTDDTFRSVISVPIGDYGVFQTHSRRVGHFTNEDLELADLLMSHVTEALKRIQSEKTIRDSEERYRTLFDNIADPIIVFDQETHLIMDCNSSFIKRYGYALDELQRMTPYNLHPPEDLKAVQENIDDKENIGPHTYTHITKGGEKFPVEIFTQELEYKGKKSWISIMRDITERKRSEEKLSTIYDLSREMSLSLNLNSVFEKVLDACEKVLDFKIIGLYLIDEMSRELCVRASRGYPEEAMAYRLPLDGESGITVWVANHKQPLIVSDISQDPRYVRGTEKFYNKSELAVPLMVGEKVIGVLNIESEKLNAFSEDDKKLLETLANQAAIAIQNARLFEETQREIAERKQVENRQAVTYRIADAANRATNLEELFGCIRDELGHVIDTTNFYIALYNAFNNEVTFPYYIDEKDSPEVIQTLHREYGEGLTEFIIETGKAALFCEDDLKQRKSIGFLARIWLGVPLITRGNTIGVMAVQSYSDPHAYTQEDLEFMEFVSSQIAIVIERKRSEEKLTAIYDLSREMSSSLDLEKILEKVMDACEKVLNFKMISLSLIDEENQYLYIKVPRGISEESKNFRLSLGEDRGITVWVAKHGESVIIPNVLEDPRYVRGDPKIATKSELAAPLKIGEKVIGVLNIESENLDAFSEDDKRLLETLAGQAAVAIQNAQLYEQAQNEISQRKKAEEKLTAMHRMAEKLTLSLDVEGVVNTTLEIAQDILEFKNCVIGFVDKEKQELCVKAQRGFPENIGVLKISLKEKGITVWVANNGQSLLVPDVSKDDRYMEWTLGIKSELCVPLKIKDEVIGILNVESEKPNAFSTEDQMLLETLASEAAVALENARLFERERDAAIQIEFLNDLMSHDINNINQISLGYLELLKNSELSEKQRMFAEKSLNSVRSSAQLVENVKKLQKLKGGEIKLEKLNLKDILVEVIPEVSHRTDKNVDVKFSPHDIWISGNPLLKDIFFNLMDNAIKYTLSRDVKIEVITQELDDSVRICIKDWGSGIPDEVKTKIFNRFERLSRGVKGSGLGLYIVKTIVTKLSGKIWVEDNPEGGSVFCVELPGVAR